MESTLDIHLRPRARRDEIVGWHGERLRIRLTAPPVEGAANAALVKFLARALGVKRSQITLARGERSREKTVRVDGLSPEMLARRVEEAIGGSR